MPRHAALALLTLTVAACTGPTPLLVERDSAVYRQAYAHTADVGYCDINLNETLRPGDLPLYRSDPARVQACLDRGGLYGRAKSHWR